MVSETKFAITTVGIMVGAAILFSVWFFGIRDTWETDHKAEILASSKNITNQKALGDTQKAGEEYKHLLAVVGSHKITDPDISKAISDAKEAADFALQQIQLKEQTDRFYAAQKEGETFLNQDNFELCIQKYKECITLYKQIQSPTPEMERLQAEITQSLPEIETRFKALKEHDALLADFAAQEKKFASIKGRIIGGAWLTKKSGNSDPLRGLQIFVLKSHAKNDQLIGVLHEKIDFYKKQIEKSNALAREYGDNEAIQKLKQNQEKLVQLLEKQLSTSSKELTDHIVDLSEIFALASAGGEDEMDIVSWVNTCKDQLVTSTHTSVDGKYALDVSGGYYYLYARFKSDYFEVKWFIPVKIDKPDDALIDFHNETARIINNLH